MTRRSATIIEIAMLAAVWCAAIALVRPAGDFPLLDDWDFAIATWNFARSGHFHFTQFTVVSLRAMVLWGAAWTRLFGESFNVLRASTLVLSLGMARVLQLGHYHRHGVATVAAAVAAFGPGLVGYGAFLFLASETLSGYVTGQIIEVNGGQYMP